MKFINIDVKMLCAFHNTSKTEKEKNLFDFNILQLYLPREFKGTKNIFITHLSFGVDPECVHKSLNKT